MEPRVGLALGSGSARGWAHIGVIRALEAYGIRPDIVAGTSIGSLVGGAYAAGYLDDLEEWVRGLQWHDIVRFLDVSLEGGLIEGRKLFDFFHRYIRDKRIEDTDCPFGAVATNLFNGQEVWFREGSLREALRASIALPGLFTPVRYKGQLLVDGGLVNPVPVSLCRAMGADVVIAVDLNAHIVGRHLRHGGNGTKVATVGDEELDALARKNGLVQSILDGANKVRDWVAERNSQNLPSILETVASSSNIMQVRITRSRMAGDPPEVLLAPYVSHLELIEFHKANEAIDAGYEAVERMRGELMFMQERLVRMNP